MERKLEGLNALVTGAGKRIGKAVALELARAGANVAVHVNQSASEGEGTRAEVEGLGRRAVVVQANQRSVSEIERACREAAGQLGAISLLVNSAAIWPHVEIDECTEEDFNLAIEVNLRGPFFWGRFLGAEMKRQGGGAIVNIADVTIDRPQPDAIPYGIAKAGIVAMTYGLAKALAPEVRVNAIGPGPILFPSDYPRASAGKDIRATLLGREGGPEDIARAVRFLFENDYITGAFIPVDGGYRFGV